MIKELGLFGACLSSVVGGVRSSATRSHEVVENGMSITYKYETNEVNSSSDLVVGHLYNFIFEPDRQVDDFDIQGYLVNTNYFYIPSGSITDSGRDEVFFEDGNLTEIKPFIDIQVYNGEYTIYLYTPTSESYINSYVSFNYESQCNINLDFVLVNSDSFENDFSLLHPSLYNEIESVERVYPDNIFGFVSEFIDENILNGIPNIDEVSSSIGGKTITLRSWLNTSICVVLACLLIGVLIWFIRYLFRLFGGLLS